MSGPTAAILCIFASAACAQEASRVAPAGPAEKPTERAKRIFWVIPNNRTFPTMKDFRPITAREKWKIAIDDAFDPGTFVLAAAFAGKSQAANGDPSFGQGMAGYGRRFATGYADFAIGDFMTEAVFPVMLRQDPRYFRKGEGSVWSRVGYAMAQIVVTHKDSGRRTINFSELGGNAAAVAISNAYYPDDRTPGDAAGKWGVQIGIDMAGNILKEFWPDLERKLSRKHGGKDSHTGSPAAASETWANSGKAASSH